MQFELGATSGQPHRLFGQAKRGRDFLAPARIPAYNIQGEIASLRGPCGRRHGLLAGGVQFGYAANAYCYAGRAVQVASHCH